MNILGFVGHILTSSLFIVVTTVSSIVQQPHHKSILIPRSQEKNISSIPVKTLIKTEITQTQNHLIDVTPTKPPPVSVSPSPSTISQVGLRATTTIYAKGKTIYLEMSFPGDEGQISGTIRGDCSGSIAGTYDGPVTGILSGEARAVCPFGFIATPVTITYNGTMNPSDKRVRIHYSLSAMGKVDEGQTTLILSLE